MMKSERERMRLEGVRLFSLLSNLFLCPARRSGLRCDLLPLRRCHRHQTTFPANHTAFTSHRGHIGREIRRNRKNLLYLRRRLYRRGPLYNPLCKLVRVARSFSFAYRHTPSSSHSLKC